VIVVVEPHADDAWLSLGAHIEAWVDEGERVQIVTVYGNARRTGEASHYADSVGAEHVGLGLPESGQGLAGDWTTELPPGSIPASLLDAADRLIGPLGIQHPEHRAVRNALLHRDPERYLELPYYRKGKNLVELNEVVGSRRVVSMRPRPARANRWSSIFASQSTFWLYNREMLTAAVEVIVQ
jgi:hypothetical protein